MPTTFFPGYLAALSIGAVAIEQVGQSGSIKFNQAVMLKPVAGVVAPASITGIETGELSVSGHCSVEDVTKLNVMKETKAELAYVFQIGALGGDDAGSYAGFVLVASLAIDWDAEGGWSFALDAVTSGLNPFTEPA